MSDPAPNFFEFGAPFPEMPGVLDIFTTQSTLYFLQVIPLPHMPLENSVSCHYLSQPTELLHAQP